MIFSCFAIAAYVRPNRACNAPYTITTDDLRRNQCFMQINFFSSCNLIIVHSIFMMPTVANIFFVSMVTWQCVVKINFSC